MQSFGRGFVSLIWSSFKTSSKKWQNKLFSEKIGQPRQEHFGIYVKTDQKHLEKGEIRFATKYLHICHCKWPRFPIRHQFGRQQINIWGRKTSERNVCNPRKWTLPKSLQWLQKQFSLIFVHTCVIFALTARTVSFKISEHSHVYRSHQCHVFHSAAIKLKTKLLQQRQMRSAPSNKIGSWEGKVIQIIWSCYIKYIFQWGENSGGMAPMLWGKLSKSEERFPHNLPHFPNFSSYFPQLVFKNELTFQTKVCGQLNRWHCHSLSDPILILEHMTSNWLSWLYRVAFLTGPPLKVQKN